MEPTIVTFTSLKFAGLKTTIRAAGDAKNDMRSVPALWQQMGIIAPSLSARLGGERYALITGDLPEGRLDEAAYHALCAVQDFHNLPPSLITFELKDGRLAKFRHKGSPQTVGMTAMKVLREWLPRAGESVAQNLELFIYPANYDRNDVNGEFEYCIILNP